VLEEKLEKSSVPGGLMKGARRHGEGGGGNGTWRGVAWRGGW
jgi:hypothetical protein